MAPALLISGLSVSFGKNPVLSGIDAEIQAGEFIGVFGPNGAGKTTLMRCLLGTLRPSRGTIEIFGQSPARAARDIGYMPQATSVSKAPRSAPAPSSTPPGGARSGACHGRRARPARRWSGVLEMTGARGVCRPALRRPLRRRAAAGPARAGIARTAPDADPRRAAGQPRPEEPGASHRMHRGGEAGLQATILFVAHDMNPLLHVMDRVVYLAGGGGAGGPGLTRW